MKCYDRKPDIETESLRIWEHKDDDEETEIDNSNSFKIKYNGLEMNLTGFTTCKDKKSNKIIFAYKFKHEERMILYYINEDLTEEEKDKIDKVLFMIKKINPLIGDYEIKDTKDVFKLMKNEKHLWKEKKEKKDDERK